MPACDLCGAGFPAAHPTDICPNCQEQLRRCPWCGETIPHAYAGRYCPSCNKPVKYAPRDGGPDLLLRSKGEIVRGGPVSVRVERLLYHLGDSAVYSVEPVKELGDAFLLEGKNPPSRLVLKETAGKAGKVPTMPEPLVERLRAIRHPNVVRTYSAWSGDERAYLLHGWAGSETLQERLLEAHRPAAPNELLSLARALAGAVLALHKAGVAHRDLTPYNVVLTSAGEPIIVDFGTAALLEDESPPSESTPGYSPPEFLPGARSNATDPSDSGVPDQYLLGATLYAAAVGRPSEETHPDTGLPVLVEASERLAGTHLHPLALLRQDLPAGLANWIDRLLSLRPQDRFPSDAEMVRALQRMRSRPGTPPSAGTRTASRRESTASAKPSPASRLWLRGVLVLAGALLLAAFRYPTTFFTHPSQLPRVAGAEVLLLLHQPRVALAILGTPSTDDGVIVAARAQLLMGDAAGAMARLRPLAHGRHPLPAAQQALDEAAEQAGEADLRNGLRLLERGHEYQAQQLLTAAVRLGVSSTDGYLTLAALRRKHGDPDGELAALHTAAAAAPGSQSAWLALLNAELRRGRAGAAYAAATRLRSLAASNPGGGASSIAPARLQTALSDAAALCRRRARVWELPDVRSASVLRGRIQWLQRATILDATPVGFADTGRGWQRLADVSPSRTRSDYEAQALRAYEQALHMDPGSATLRSLVARLSRSTGVRTGF